VSFVTHIGPLLIKLRQERGISQAELARRARISAHQLGKIERSAAAPRNATRIRLADALGVEVALLTDLGAYLTALEED
jgi:transcriptional regulator with XRE-family HTH domain